MSRTMDLDLRGEEKELALDFPSYIFRYLTYHMVGPSVHPVSSRVNTPSAGWGSFTFLSSPAEAFLR